MGIDPVTYQLTLIVAIPVFTAVGSRLGWREGGGDRVSAIGFGFLGALGGFVWPVVVAALVVYGALFGVSQLTMPRYLRRSGRR